MNLLIENKIYPRERSKVRSSANLSKFIFTDCSSILQELLHRGRIRLQLKNEDGTAINPDLANRRQILKYVGQMIPQLKSRIANPKGGEAPVQAASTQQGGNKKGKGKKR
jgi:signal recognition particle subunit SRP19